LRFVYSVGKRICSRLFICKEVSSAKLVDEPLGNTAGVVDLELACDGTRCCCFSIPMDVAGTPELGIVVRELERDGSCCFSILTYVVRASEAGIVGLELECDDCRRWFSISANAGIDDFGVE
jgi:hypothetical protein